MLLLVSVRSELEPVQLRHWVGSEWPWKMHFVFNQLCLLRVDAGSGFGMLWWHLVTQTSFEERVAHRALNAQVQPCEHSPALSSLLRVNTQTGGTFVCAADRVCFIVNTEWNEVINWLASPFRHITQKLSDVWSVGDSEQGDWKVLTELHCGRRHLKLSDRVPGYSPWFRQWSKTPVRAGIESHEIEHQGFYN